MMKSALFIKPHYKNVLEAAKKMYPDLNDNTALACYIEVQSKIELMANQSFDLERMANAMYERSWATELYSVFETRRN